MWHLACTCSVADLLSEVQWWGRGERQLGEKQHLGTRGAGSDSGEASDSQVPFLRLGLSQSKSELAGLVSL